MKTTKAHFEIFKKEAQKWIQFFGLLDWEIIYTHGCEDKDNLAEVAYNVTARTAIVRLGTEWPAKWPVDNLAVRKSAFHEICHLLVAPFDGSRDNWDSNHAEMLNESEIHAFIQRMTNSVWESSIKKEKTG